MKAKEKLLFVEDTYKKYSKDVFRYAMFRLNDRSEAEDATSETFIRLLGGKDFDSKESIKPWIISITRNVIREKYRENQKETQNVRIDDEFDYKDEWDIPIDEKLADEEQVGVVKKELESIDEFTREVIMLKIWEEMKFDQIAKVTEQNENTVKAVYYRGLEKMKSGVQKKTGVYTFGVAFILSSVFNLSKAKAYEASPTFVAKTAGVITNLNINSLTMDGGTTATLTYGVISKVAIGLIGTGTVAYGGMSIYNNVNHDRIPSDNGVISQVQVEDGDGLNLIPISGPIQNPDMSNIEWVKKGDYQVYENPEVGLRFKVPKYFENKATASTDEYAYYGKNSCANSGLNDGILIGVRTKDIYNGEYDYNSTLNSSKCINNLGVNLPIHPERFYSGGIDTCVDLAVVRTLNNKEIGIEFGFDKRVAECSLDKKRVNSIMGELGDYKARLQEILNTVELYQPTDINKKQIATNNGQYYLRGNACFFPSLESAGGKCEVVDAKSGKIIYTADYSKDGGAYHYGYSVGGKSKSGVYLAKYYAGDFVQYTVFNFNLATKKLEEVKKYSPKDASEILKIRSDMYYGYGITNFPASSISINSEASKEQKQKNKIVSLEIYNNECEYKIGTTNGPIFLSTNISEANPKVECSSFVLGKASESGQYMAYKDMSPIRPFNMLSVYSLEYQLSTQLDVYADDEKIFDFTFLPDGKLVTLSGVRGSYDQQKLRVFDIEKLYRDSQVRQNGLYFTYMPSYSKVVPLQNVGEDYSQVSVRDGKLVVYGQGKILKEYVISDLVSMSPYDFL